MARLGLRRGIVEQVREEIEHTLQPIVLLAVIMNMVQADRQQDANVQVVEAVVNQPTVAAALDQS
jgi:hypothetical protein